MALDLTTLPGFRIFDPDDAGADITLMIAASAGTITVSAGNSGISNVTGSGTALVSFKGTSAELNALFRDQTTGTLVFSTATPGVITFTMAATDATGQSSTIAFEIEAVDLSAPSVTCPAGPILVNIPTPGSVSLLGQSITITDADDAGNPVTLEFSIGAGSFAFTAGTSGVSLVSGNNSSTLTLSGTLVRLNSLLAGQTDATLTYTHNASGNQTLTVEATDSDSLAGSDTVTIGVGNVPVVSAPSTAIVAIESTNKSLEGLGFSFTDADSAGTYTAVLHTTVGTIDVTVGNSGVTIASGDTTATVTLTGSISQLNNLLDDTSTGTIVLSPGSSTTTGTITLTITDATTRSGSNSASVYVAPATPTWTTYATATAPAPSNTLNNFPTLVDLSRLPDDWWAKVSTDGRDIRFTTASNTQLAGDLIKFNYSAKTGLAVVNMTHDTGTRTVRVWCGALSATALGDTDTYGRENAYVSTIRGFWPDGIGTDRTGYDNDTTQSGGLAIGGASGPLSLTPSVFDGVDDYATASASIPTAVPCYLIAFVKPTGTIKVRRVLSVTPTAAASPAFSLDLAPSGSAYLTQALAYSGSKSGVATAVGSIVNGAWSMVSAILASSTSRQASVNGAQTGANSTNVAFTVSSPVLRIGATGGTATAHFEGQICLAMLRTGLAGNEASFLKHFALSFDQATFFPSWTTTTGQSLTGL